MMLKAFCILSVRPRMHHILKAVNTSYKPLVPLLGISPNFQLQCKDEMFIFWGQKVKCQGHTTVAGIFIYLRNAWMNVNETYHNYSLPGPCDTDDIVKVIGSKVKVTDNIF